MYLWPHISTPLAQNSQSTWRGFDIGPWNINFIIIDEDATKIILFLVHYQYWILFLFELKKWIWKLSADCTWDFFGCTNRAGDWPQSKQCCQARFDACCMKVMAGKKKPGQSHFPEPVPSPVATTVRPQQASGSRPPPHQTQNPADKIKLSKNIFKLGQLNVNSSKIVGTTRLMWKNS